MHYDNDWGSRSAMTTTAAYSAPTPTTWSCPPLPILCPLPSVSCWPAAGQSCARRGPRTHCWAATRADADCDEAYESYHIQT